LQKASNNLLRLPCSSDEKRRIKKIVNKSKEHLKQWSGYGEQLKAWSELLSDLTIDNDPEIIAQYSSTGFLSRLFRKTNTLSESEFSSPAISQEESINALAPEAVIDEKDTPDYESIEQDITTMLSNLLAQLVIPLRFNDQVDNLKSKLMSKLNGDELVPLLEQVANLVIDTLGDGQEEFENFLQGLNQRLGTIQ
jgi:diguanylate cyclase